VRFPKTIHYRRIEATIYGRKPPCSKPNAS
jgi:hypothetical protein